MDPLKVQYEKFPYPPVPFLALPRKDQGNELHYPRPDFGIRILVAGCGTLETAIVAQSHPLAREIVSVDLSESSIRISRKRLRWMKITRPLAEFPGLVFVVGDVSSQDLGDFDYILASNLLHHAADPAHLLFQLAQKLRSGGILRVVTYPKGSRYWMRKTSAWLKKQGIEPETPNLVSRTRKAIRSLPAGNPLRSCFESQPETGTRAGLIDAFLNARENPLSPVQWGRACHDAGLKLIGEGQRENSRSSFLDAFLKNPDSLTTWEKLQILDDTWELCSNPVFWLEKSGSSEPPPETGSEPVTLAEQLSRADRMLRKAGSSLREYHSWLQKDVGPRTHPTHQDELLRGISLAEYDLDQLLAGGLDSEFPARL